MDHLVKVFSIIHRHSFIFLDRKLKTINVTSGQSMYILSICEHPGLSQEQLSSELKIDKGSVARMVKQFEADGYLVRKTSTDDRRQNQIYPTEKAKNLYQEICAIVTHYEEDLVQNLTDIEKNILRNLLDKITEQAV